MKRKSNQLYTSSNNSRTHYPVSDLVELTLKIIHNGFMPSKPLLVTKDGEVLQGNRRLLCAVLATYIMETFDGNRQDIDTELVESVIRQVLTDHGERVDGDERPTAIIAVSKLQEGYVIDLPAVLFKGNAKEKAVAFFDATGTSKPDLYGEAMAIKRAIDAGWMENELANHFGKKRTFINNRLALTEVEKRLVDAIDQKTYSMGTAVAIAGVPEHKRSALVDYAMSMVNEFGKSLLTVSRVKQLAKELADFDGFIIPLTYERIAQRNIALALSSMWQAVLDEDPDRAWRAVLEMTTVDGYKAPWLSPKITNQWIDNLIGQPANGLYMPIVVQYLKEHVNCNKCPISQLPEQILKVDLPKLPCRINQQQAFVTLGCCANGFRESDMVNMLVPDTWHANEGVQAIGTSYGVKSYADLELAWSNQRDKELKAAEAERKAAEPIPQIQMPDTSAVEEDDGDVEETAVVEVPPEAAVPAQAELPPPLDDEEDEELRPIDQMRAKLNTYIVLHNTMPDSDNPLAAQCVNCRYYLESNECEWAKSGTLRTVRFSELVGVHHQTKIPFCHQYRPSRTWYEFVPDVPAWDDMDGYPSRQAMIETILQLVELRKLTNSTDVQMFQWLTGRPLNTTENYQTWFATELEEQHGDMRVSQVAFLYLMAVQELLRTDRQRQFQVPMFDGEAMSMWETVREQPMNLEDA